MSRTLLAFNVRTAKLSLVLAAHARTHTHIHVLFLPPEAKGKKSRSCGNNIRYDKKAAEASKTHEQNIKLVEGLETMNEHVKELLKEKGECTTDWKS